MGDTARALLLAGPMGAGKTTLARLLQDQLPEPWLILGDETNVRFPRHRRRFLTLGFDHAVRRGNVRALIGYLDEGLNVITEWFLWEPWARGMTAAVLARRPVYIVKLWCALDVAQRRLVEKGQQLGYDENRVDEALRYGRWQYEVEPWDLPHDLLVHTDDLTPDQVAERVASWMSTEPDVNAIRHLA
jgi:chloramphenicol 3-O-phosphotransferase